MRGILRTLGVLLCAAASLPGQGKPDFKKDVQPVLRRKCVMCHNERLSQNGVRLDDGDAALAGGYSGPVILPGKSAESKLIARVSSTKKGFMMPPAGTPLTEAEVAILKQWIDAGAEWPRAPKAAAAKPPSGHWSFQPITRPDEPAVKLKGWSRNAIDRFVLARLEKEAIAPSPEASKTVLLRRLTFDLTGLPPTPQEVREFLADDRPDAYEQAVERLLSSEHYGEQRARAWLDLARYADSDGLEKDLVRPFAWRYRNWVIDAYNHDLPFDEFTIEQLAGDLLPNPRVEQRVATGFHRNTLTNREGGTDPEESRFEQLVNRTNTTGTTWLGLTMGCSQCHDHKYDPIKQKDYYSLMAFFNQSEEVDIDAPLPGEYGAWMRGQAEYRERRAALLREYEVEPLQAEWEEKIRESMDHPGKDADWDFSVSNGRPMLDRFETLLRTPKAQRTERENDLVMRWFVRTPGPYKNRDVDKLAALKDFRRRLDNLDKEFPKLTQAMTMMELEKPPETHIAIKGDFRAKGLKVDANSPGFLPPLPEGAPRNRLTLARWLVSEQNPLTARVAVNRLWMEFFGRGLVKTTEDFGTQGDAPSHAELLDWLASEFRENGWSVKHMVRLVVNSAAYRQSSHTSKELMEKDPENVLLARQSRVRLPAESIRDAALAAGGLINRAVGGPSVRPPQPSGVAELGYANSVKWAEDEGPARYRRGMYIHLQRTTPYPMLMNFDAPDSYVACARRRRSNSPLQALNLLNDPVFFEAAQALAMRVLREAPAAERLDYAFELALGRAPSPKERERVQKYIAGQAGALKPEQAKALLPLAPEQAAWTGAARVLLNLEEFITRE